MFSADDGVFHCQRLRTSGGVFSSRYNSSSKIKTSWNVKRLGDNYIGDTKDSTMLRPFDATWPWLLFQDVRVGSPGAA